MYPDQPGMLPIPLTSIDNLFDNESTSSHQIPLKVFFGQNLGYRTFLASIPLHKFFDLSEVANDPGLDGALVAQRKLDLPHATRLAVYIIKGLVSSAIKSAELKNYPALGEFKKIQDNLGKQPYMSLQPIVVNIRGSGDIQGARLQTAEGETASFKIYLSQKETLWVVDGQHRRKALEMVFEFLNHIRTRKSYPKKGSLYNYENEELSPSELALWELCFSIARSDSTIAVEIHLGLSIDQERQLFHDLNRLGKKVEAGLALKFDSSNPINLFIKETVIDRVQIKVSEQDQKDWKKDDGSLSRKDITAINSILFLNKSNISGATPTLVSDREDLAKKFWESISQIPGFGEDNAKEQTVAAQPVVLKALAKLIFDFAFNMRRPENGDVIIEQILDEIPKINYDHNNPVWNYYNMSEADRTSANIEDLKRWLPEDNESVNRDIGSIQGEHMRFGAKHNDIYPILGDMIRYQMKLPSRHTK